MHTKPINPTASSDEWSYLRAEAFWLLVAFALGSSTLLYFLNNDSRASFTANSLIVAQIALASFSLLAFRWQARIGQSLLTAAATVGFLLWLTTLSGPAAAPLLIAPLLAVLAAWGVWPALVVAATLAAFLLFPPLQDLYPLLPATRSALLAMLAFTWLCGCLIHARNSRLLQSLLSRYSAAHRQLEQARDHRLALNQANHELAEAYVQLRRLSQLYQASRLEAEVARHAKEEFAANVSHELRTPLNMIIGFSEIILFSPTTYLNAGRLRERSAAYHDEQFEDYQAASATLPAALLSDMRVIHANSKHLSQLINDVLELSQADAGKMILSRTWIHVKELVDETVSALLPLYTAKALPLTILPLPADLTLFCDHLRIRQILLNLLSNAGRYTTTGGVTLQVALTGNDIVFSVTDTGPGIPLEDQERIFEPFQQGGKATNRSGEGTGLGLTISKRLVEAHGGRMWLVSTPDAGATFSFSLPYTIDTLSSAAARWVNTYASHEPRPHIPLPELPQPKNRLLLLTQEEELCQQLQTLLDAGPTPFEVVNVADPAHLESAIKETAPAALLINEARVMNDRNFVRRHFDQLPLRLPIISCHLPGKQEACDYLNVVEYLVKPVTATRLLQVVAQFAAANTTILLVEDQPDMARLIRRQLAAAGRGYRMLHAADGEQALEQMRSRHPDLVLLDLGLPNPDGFGVLESKNGDPTISAIPVVIVSARDPLGESVVADRLRVELPGGLSLRDVVQCTLAITNVISHAGMPLKPSAVPKPAEMLLDPQASG